MKFRLQIAVDIDADDIEKAMQEYRNMLYNGTSSISYEMQQRMKIMSINPLPEQ